MSGRSRGGSSNAGFSSSFSRRPAGGGGGGGMSSSGSLLGDPPRRQQQQLYDPFADSERDSGRSYGRSGSGGDAYDRQGGSSGGYGTGTYSSSSSAGPGYGQSGRNEYGTPSQTQFATPVQRQRDGASGRGQDSGSTWRKRSPSPPPHHHNDSDYSRGRQSPTWSGQQSRGFDNMRQQTSSMFKPNTHNMQGGNSMGMGGQHPQQQLVMVVPQGQGGSGGLMGMMPVTQGQNPFGQRQAPMQVILGNLPAFNPNIFDQQLLASANGPFGNNAQMGGMMNPSLQGPGGFGRSPGSSAYGRDSMGSDWKERLGRNTSARQRNSLGSASAGRRSDSNRNNLVSRAGSGRGSLGGGGNSASALSPRGGRKRGGSDRLAEEIERKKLKPGFGTPNNRDRVARTSVGQPNTPYNRTLNRAAQNNKRKSDNNNKNKNGQTPKPKTPPSILKKGGPQQKGTPQKSENGKEKDKKPTTPAKTGETDDKEKATDDKAVADKNEVTALDQKETVTDKEGQSVTGDEKVGEEAEKAKKKSKYDEFPPGLLVCKVCQKTMNDGASYESHLNGRAHTALVKIVESRFQKRAELLMYESKLTEEEIGIELERQRRAGKPGTGAGSKNKNHCKMCDCNYTVNWGTHKISLGHRILKEFLHPTCRFCDTQFVHRMDWLNHLFSLNHLRRLYELKAEGKELKEQESSNQAELFAISIEMNSEEHPINFITIRNSDWKVPSKDDLKELLQDENGEMEIPEGEIVIPVEYDENVAVGEDTILKTTGFCCKVCRIYMTQEKEVLPHLQNKSHFGMYVAFLKKLGKLKELKKKEEADAAAAAAAAAEAAEVAKKEAEEKIKKEAEDKLKEVEKKETVEVAVDSVKTEGNDAVAANTETSNDEVTILEPMDTNTSEVVDLGEEEEGDDAAGDEALEEPEEFTVEDEVGGDEEVDLTSGSGEQKKKNGSASVETNDVEMTEGNANEATAKQALIQSDEVEVAEKKLEIPVADTAKEPEKVVEKMPPPAVPAARPPQTASRGNRGIRGNRGAPSRGNTQGANRGRGGPGSFQQSNRGVRGSGTSGPGARGRGGPMRRPAGNTGAGGVRGRGRGRPY